MTPKQKFGVLLLTLALLFLAVGGLMVWDGVYSPVSIADSKPFWVGGISIVIGLILIGISSDGLT